MSYSLNSLKADHIGDSRGSIIGVLQRNVRSLDNSSHILNNSTWNSAWALCTYLSVRNGPELLTPRHISEVPNPTPKTLNSQPLSPKTLIPTPQPLNPKTHNGTQVVAHKCKRRSSSASFLAADEVAWVSFTRGI